MPLAGVLGETFELGKRTLEGPPCAHDAENERVGRLWKLAEHDEPRVQHGRRLVHAAREASLRPRASVVEALARVARAEDPQGRQRLRRPGQGEDMPSVEDLANAALDLGRAGRGAERLEGASTRGEPVEQIAPARGVGAVGDEVAVEALGIWADLHLRGEGSFGVEDPAEELLGEAIVAMAHPAGSLYVGRDPGQASGSRAMSTCSMRAVRSPTLAKIYRDTYADYTDATVQFVGEFSTADLLDLEQVPTDEHALQDAVREWLDRLAISWPSALPKSAAAREPVLQYLVPEITGGRVSSDHRFACGFTGTVVCRVRDHIVSDLERCRDDPRSGQERRE